ncbi:MAG: four helix bundle protein [Mucilaginibacter sp.]|nr:four helix bundle protein [Mucilaginibacter sp.]
MSFYNLEDLEVYQRSESFGDEIWFVVNEWDYFAKTLLANK